jgi:hypothetical protein
MHNPLKSDLALEEQIWLDKLNRMGMEPFQAHILGFLQRGFAESTRIAFWQALERYLFVVSLADIAPNAYIYLLEFRTRGFDSVFDPSNSDVSADKLIRALTERTHTIVKESHFLKHVRSRFKSDGFYKWQGIRYFLYEYNLDLQNRSKTRRRKIFWPEFSEDRADFVSVEHIYPQQARDKYWTTRFAGLGQKQRSALRSSLGNLLPLSKPKNASLSNRPFPAKIEGKDDPIGYRYGCYAENEVAKSKDWTPREILNRGLIMLDFMERRWGLALGNEAQKKSMLGLDFMK